LDLGLRIIHIGTMILGITIPGIMILGIGVIIITTMIGTPHIMEAITILTDGGDIDHITGITIIITIQETIILTIIIIETLGTEPIDQELCILGITIHHTEAVLLKALGPVESLDPVLQQIPELIEVVL